MKLQKTIQKTSKARGRLHEESHTQSGRVADSEQKHVVDSQAAETDLLETGKDNCQAPQSPLDQTRLLLGTQQDQPSKKVAANKEDKLTGRHQHVLTTIQLQWRTTTSRAT